MNMNEHLVIQGECVAIERKHLRGDTLIGHVLENSVRNVIFGLTLLSRMPSQVSWQERQTLLHLQEIGLVPHTRGDCGEFAEVVQ